MAHHLTPKMPVVLVPHRDTIAHLRGPQEQLCCAAALLHRAGIAFDLDLRHVESRGRTRTLIEHLTLTRYEEVTRASQLLNSLPSFFAFETYWDDGWDGPAERLRRVWEIEEGKRPEKHLHLLELGEDRCEPYAEAGDDEACDDEDDEDGEDADVVWVLGAWWAAVTSFRVAQESAIPVLGTEASTCDDGTFAVRREHLAQLHRTLRAEGYVMNVERRCPQSLTFGPLLPLDRPTQSRPAVV